VNVPWDEAPPSGTPERRAFYDYYKLDYDDSIDQNVPASKELPKSPALKPKQDKLSFLKPLNIRKVDPNALKEYGGDFNVKDIKPYSQQSFLKDAISNVKDFWKDLRPEERRAAEVTDREPIKYAPQEIMENYDPDKDPRMLQPEVEVIGKRPSFLEAAMSPGAIDPEAMQASMVINKRKQMAGDLFKTETVQAQPFSIKTKKLSSQGFGGAGGYKYGG
tara:strand:- start:1309 stop:1965 length:657 start_codon:yes stop_codon:yes gene_type:complete